MKVLFLIALVALAACKQVEPVEPELNKETADIIKCFLQSQILRDDLVKLIEAIQSKDGAKIFMVVLEIYPDFVSEIKKCMGEDPEPPKIQEINGKPVAEIIKCFLKSQLFFDDLVKLIDAIKTKDGAKIFACILEIYPDFVTIVNKCTEEDPEPQPPSLNEANKETAEIIKCFLQSTILREDLVKLIEAIQSKDGAKIFMVVLEIYPDFVSEIKKCMGEDPEPPKIEEINGKPVAEIIKCFLKSQLFFDDLVKLIDAIKTKDGAKIFACILEIYPDFVTIVNKCTEEDPEPEPPKFDEMNKETADIIKCFLQSQILRDDLVKLIEAIQSKDGAKIFMVVLEIYPDFVSEIKKCMGEDPEPPSLEAKPVAEIIKCFLKSQLFFDDLVKLIDAIKTKDGAKIFACILEIYPDFVTIVNKCTEEDPEPQPPSFREMNKETADIIKCFLQSQILRDDLVKLIEAIQSKDGAKIFMVVLEIYPDFVSEIKKCMGEDPEPPKNEANKEIAEIIKCFLQSQLFFDDLVKLVDAIKTGDGAKIFMVVLEIYPDMVSEIKKCIEE